MASAAVVSERTRSAPATAASVSGASGSVDGSGSKPRTVAPAARRAPGVRGARGGGAGGEASPGPAARPGGGPRASAPPASPGPTAPIAATLRRPGPLPLDEPPPQHLARRGLGDRVDDLDAPQLL